MSNGIIEIGIPKNCDECPIRQVALAYCLIAKKSTSHRPSGKTLDQSKRPNWCPIKTKTDGWIPVSEHLPEEGGRYLVSYLGYDGKKYVGIFEFNPGYWEAELDAWMPLPEPYRR